jgi:hypothetical protein
MLAPYTWEEDETDVRGVRGGWDESGFIWNEEFASNDE